MTPDLAVIVPTFGRPHSAIRIAREFYRTCTGDTHLFLVVQDSDNRRQEYINSKKIINDRTHVIPAPVGVGGSGFVAPTNWGAEYVLQEYDPFAIGFMGDDHSPQTTGWDVAFTDALRELGTGYVYGDDRIQGEAMTTHIAMTADIVRGFGYLANPICAHLYSDVMWRDLGLAANCIKYLPWVTVEHMHYTHGKSPDDDTYKIGNSKHNWDTDPATYRKWRRGQGIRDDVATLMRIRDESGNGNVR